MENSTTLEIRETCRRQPKWLCETGHWPYNYPVPANLHFALREILLTRTCSTAGWPYSARSRQLAVEPTALAILATGSPPTALMRTQNPDGSWAPLHPEASSCWPASWATSLAVLALLRTKPDARGIQRAVEWLCSSRGIESHWLWRWKFKSVDTQVRFDPDKFGWNWAPGTVSWVVPTALAILALRTAAKHNFGSANSQRRIQLGIEMLLDRVCPGGGWNAGNGVAFGVALAPHVEATALALLALQKTKSSGHRLVQASLDWLVEQTRQCRGITSTAWAILALHAYQTSPVVVRARLARLTTLLDPPDQVIDNASLALSALALDTDNGRNAFEAPA